MANKDYMPKKDDEFDIFQTNVFTTSSANYAKWLISNQVISALGTPRTKWMNAYNLYKNPLTRSPLVTQDKIDARKDYEPALRTFIQGQLMHNTFVTDGDRRSMGLPIHDTTPSPAPAPETRTEMDVVFKEIMQHDIHVRNSGSKTSGKPPHVAGFELWRHIGGDQEPSYDDMQLIGQITHSPHKVKYPAADRGKKVWYISRWVSTRGEPGPWSEIVSALVP